MSKLTRYTKTLFSNVTRHARTELHFWYQEVRHVAYGLRSLFQDTITIRNKGRLFTVPTGDLIGSDIYINGQYIEHDLSLKVVDFLKTNKFMPASDVTMLDVGSNIGPIAIGLVMAGKVDRAIAIEPEPRNFSLLQKNVQQNDLASRILCLQLAVGEMPGALTMELSRANGGDHRIQSDNPRTTGGWYAESPRHKIEVQSLPLPRILEMPQVRDAGLGKPGFMWIDVQGYEGYAFKSAAGLLRDGLPTVAEIWPYGLLRAGMPLDEFCRIVGSIWTDYWIERHSHFVRYPIAVFDRFLDELGSEGHYENVIFTKSGSALSGGST